MPNSFYNHSSGVPATQTRGSSLNIRAELDLIEAAFDEIETTPVFTGPVSAPLGSASLPSYTITGDLDTGMWSPTANTLAWSTGGTERMRIDSSGRVGIGATPTSGRSLTVGANHTQPVSYGVLSNGVAQSTSNSVGFGTQANTAAASFTQSYNIGFSANVGTIGSGSTITNLYGFYIAPQFGGGTNTYGFYSWLNSGSNNWNLYMQGSAPNYLAGRTLIGINTENSNGGILQLSSGITFPATQVASTDPNTLDDYEEGSFTPAFNASGSTFSYFKQVGRYTKIGNKVTCWGTLVLNGSGNTLSSNNLVITGLPFPAKNGDAYINQPAAMDWAQFDTALVNLMGVMLPTATFLTLKYLTAAGVSPLTLTANRMSTSAGTYVGFGVTYDTD